MLIASKALIAALLLAMAFVSVPEAATPIQPNGVWTVLDEDMTVGDFFPGGPWTFSNTAPVQFRITDLFVVSDQYNVFDNGVLVLTTPQVPDWNTFPGLTPFTSPPFTTDPDSAFISGFFTRATIILPPGSHSITIQDIHIPPSSVGGPPFPDGTVAFSLVSAGNIPTLSEWGTIGMIVLLAGMGISVMWRRNGRALASRRPGG